MGILRAIWDAIGGQVDAIGGRSFSRSVDALSETETGGLEVESTIRFGEVTAGAGDALLLVDGELVYAASRTTSAPYRFETLTRGEGGTRPVMAPAGALVFDASGNRTALDLTRRSLFVRTAVGSDLDVIGRNLGLHRCPGLDEEAWRRLIQAIAFAPKGVIDTFEEALLAIYGSTSSFEVLERLATNPYDVFVRITAELASGVDSIRGRLILSGGLPAVSDGLTTVTVDFNGSPLQLRNVLGVYLDTTLTRRGYRAPEGFVNYLDSFTPGGATITLSPSPGPIGTPLLVDATGYGADASIAYHFLAPDETARDDDDRYGYLSDPTRIARCVLNQVRPAGRRVVVSML